MYSVHYQGIPVPLLNHQYRFGVRNLFMYVCVYNNNAGRCESATYS